LAFDPTTPTVELVRHIGAAGSGGASAQIFADAQGLQYVVKLKENNQNLRVLTNEFVTNKLAQFLEVPAPQASFATFPAALVAENTALSATVGGKAVSTGPHFALRNIGTVLRNPPADTINRAKNKPDVAGILVLDVLTLNSDRNASSNLLALRPDFDPSAIYISAIDHGHCFGNPTWDQTLAQRSDQDHCPLMNELLGGIAGPNPFGSYFARLQDLTNEIIGAIVNQIPSDWGVSDLERQALNEFLSKRGVKVAEIITRHKAQMPNWM